jgi:hypothetical protein
MFSPMFSTPPDVFGIPLGLLVAAVAFVPMVIGFLWMRRITGGDQEPQSFRATADRRVGPSAAVMLGIAILGLAAILVLTNGGRG